MGVWDVPHGLSRLKKTICQIKCSLLAWWALKRYSRQDLCEHPSSILPVHPAISGFFSIPQPSPSLTFIPGDSVGFVLCQGQKGTVCVREAQRQIFCQEENSVVCLRDAEAHQKHVTIKAESPNRATVLLSSVSFP